MNWTENNTADQINRKASVKNLYKSKKDPKRHKEQHPTVTADILVVSYTYLQPGL